METSWNCQYMKSSKQIHNVGQVRSHLQLQRAPVLSTGEEWQGEALQPPHLTAPCTQPHPAGKEHQTHVPTGMDGEAVEMLPWAAAQAVTGSQVSVSVTSVTVTLPSRSSFGRLIHPVHHASNRGDPPPILLKRAWTFQRCWHALPRSPAGGQCSKDLAPACGTWGPPCGCPLYSPGPRAQSEVRASCQPALQSQREPGDVLPDAHISALTTANGFPASVWTHTMGNSLPQKNRENVEQWLGWKSLLV